MENQNYKNENIEREFLNNCKKKQFLKVKNSLLEWENNSIVLKDSELKDREKKLKERWKNYFLNRLLCLKMIWIGLKKKRNENKTN